MARHERTFRTEGIILRRHDFGEADRLLTVLTPEHGKLRGIAKGVRKPAGRMTGHVELFSCAMLMVAHGRELFTISQAEEITPFVALRESLDRGAYGYYIVELLDRFSEFEETNIALYHLLKAALEQLTQPEADLRLTTRYFELHLLELVGFRPVLFKCAAGGETLDPQDQYFSPMDGGVVCPDHVRGRVVMPLSLTTLKMLRYMQSQPYEIVAKLRVGADLHAELERILQGYILHLLETRLKSVDFIHSLRRHTRD